MKGLLSASERMDIRLVFARDTFSLDVDVSLAQSGVTGVFGPSGAGKSTLLRLLAGLERPQTAVVMIGGETWDDTSRGIRLRVHERATGFVFQQPTLFPHFDVLGNLRYAERRARGERVADLDTIVALLAIESLLGRQPATLSGGEAQRVAIARALLHAPQLMLMDEPVAALDLERRGEVLPFIERLHRELDLPILYVSHNIDEICMLCDQLVVLESGRVVAHGDLSQVLLRTALPVLGGDEACTVLEATVTAYDPEFDLSRVTVSGGTLWVPGRYDTEQDSLRLRVRANDVSLARERARESSILNALDVRVVAVERESASSVLVKLAAADSRLIARITAKSCAELGLCEGSTLVAQIKSVSVRHQPYLANTIDD